MAQPRLTDRPTDARATFQHCDTGGTLSKRRFTSAVRGGFRDHVFAVFKAIHAGALAKFAEPERVVDATVQAIKQGQRRGRR